MAASRRPPEPPQVPWSCEAEQSVLGGLLLDNGAWGRVSDVLTDRTFYRFEHGEVYSAIGALVTADRPADVITVFEQLQHQGRGDECGGVRYLNSLAQSVPSASNIRHYAEIVREKASLRALLAGLDEAGAAARDAPDAAQAIGRAQQIIGDLASHAGAPAELFRTVDLAHLGELAPQAQEWALADLIPSGHPTLLNGHGGAGKSTLAATFACCAAAGREFLGKATKRSNVVFFSGEDPAELLLRRLDRICRHLEIDPRVLRERLHVLDATDFDPVLFFERRSDGSRSGATTPTYAALARFVEHHAIDLLIVDNASDTFEADEINRAMVRAFIRSLVRLVRPRNGAVLLLAHVDKGTSRAGKSPTNSEGYSGSTAWHNSARSRLLLLEKDPGVFELQHQKSNLGPKHAPIALEWPADGLLQRPAEAGGFVAAMGFKADAKALLRLIHEFGQRGEFVAHGTTSPSNAARLLAQERTYPKALKPGEVFALLRDAERDGWLAKDEYRDANRKSRERWALTPAGEQAIGVAPSARTARTSQDGAAHG